MNGGVGVGVGWGVVGGSGKFGEVCMQKNVGE